MNTHKLTFGIATLALLATTASLFVFTGCSGDDSTADSGPTNRDSGVSDSTTGTTDSGKEKRHEPEQRCPRRDRRGRGCKRRLGRRRFARYGYVRERLEHVQHLLHGRSGGCKPLQRVLAVHRELPQVRSDARAGRRSRTTLTGFGRALSARPTKRAGVASLRRWPSLFCWLGPDAITTPPFAFSRGVDVRAPRAHVPRFSCKIRMPFADLWMSRAESPTTWGSGRASVAWKQICCETEAIEGAPLY